MKIGQLKLSNWNSDNLTLKQVKDGNSVKVYTKFNNEWLFIYRIFK